MILEKNMKMCSFFYSLFDFRDMYFVFLFKMFYFVFILIIKTVQVATKTVLYFNIFFNSIFIESIFLQIVHSGTERLNYELTNKISI